MKNKKEWEIFWNWKVGWTYSLGRTRGISSKSDIKYTKGSKPRWQICYLLMLFWENNIFNTKNEPKLIANQNIQSVFLIINVSSISFLFVENNNIFNFYSKFLLRYIAWFLSSFYAHYFLKVPGETLSKVSAPRIPTKDLPTL